MLLGGVAAFSVSHTHTVTPPGASAGAPDARARPVGARGGVETVDYISSAPKMYGIAVCIVQMYPNSIGFVCIRALPCRAPTYLLCLSWCLVAAGCAPRVCDCVSCQTTRPAPGATRSRAAAAAPQPKTQTRNGRQRGARIPCTTYPVSKVHHPTRTRDVRRTGLPRAHTDHRHTRAETAEYSAPDTLEP